MSFHLSCELGGNQLNSSLFETWLGYWCSGPEPSTEIVGWPTTPFIAAKPSEGTVCLTSACSCCVCDAPVTHASPASTKQTLLMKLSSSMLALSARQCCAYHSFHSLASSIAFHEREAFHLVWSAKMSPRLNCYHGYSLTAGCCHHASTAWSILLCLRLSMTCRCCIKCDSPSKLLAAETLSSCRPE